MKNETIDKIKSVAEISAAIGFIGLPVFAFGALVGSCAQRKCELADKKKNKTIIQATPVDIIGGTIAPNSKKVFDKGQHFISIRIPNRNEISNEEVVNYAVNNNHEGYNIYQITPYTNMETNTNGYDIWFVNNQPVEVEATFNNTLKQFGYYSFGKPVDKDKILTK